MNESVFRPANVAAGAVVIGGVLLVALPRYAVSIVQVVIVTVAAAWGLYVLAVHVPSTGWMSPFKWMSPFGRGVPPRDGADGADELESIRSRLSGRRQPIEGGPALPPETLGLLQPLIREALALSSDDEAPAEVDREKVSPLTWAALTSDPMKDVHWLNSLPPDHRQVAEVVRRVLDDVERLASGAADPRRPMEPIAPPTP